MKIKNDIKEKKLQSQLETTEEAKQVRIASMTPPQSMSPEAMIMQAINKGADIAVIERVIALGERLRDQQAKQAFDQAMAEFQGECPTIKKTKDGGKTKTGQVAYKYAPLEVIVEQTRELIRKHGFSYAIKIEIIIEGIKAICIVKHKLGHSEESSMQVPLGGGTAIMSAPQVVAANSTFAKRYAFCNAFGIMTGDDDTDASQTPPAHPQTKLPKLQAQPITGPVLIEEVLELAQNYGAEKDKEREFIDKTLGVKINWAKLTNNNIASIQARLLAKLVANPK